ncbi:MAG: thioredoxin family protein [Phycisphaerales bacterium]
MRKSGLWKRKSSRLINRVETMLLHARLLSERWSVQAPVSNRSMAMKSFRSVIGLLLVVSILPGIAVAGEAAKKDAAEREPIYHPDADAPAQIAKALQVAQRDNKRVLLMYGGNWCGWCWRLHDCLQDNKELHDTLRSEYVMVMVDIQNNQGLLTRYDAEPDGYPYLTVLDADGSVLINQSTVPFEVNNGHDPDKVLAFLTEWKPLPQVAEDVYKAALALAKAEDKRVFVHLGAPWCGWCHRFEDFLYREEVASILSQDYVMVKIDLSRMTGGKEFGDKLVADKPGGIPWYAVLDADGNKLMISVGPKGNTVFPTNEYDFTYFNDMLKQTASRITDEQLATIDASIRDAAEPYRD